MRRLNRNLVLIADSDKDSAWKRINKTKKRVRDEFVKGKGFAWITKGREIENYVDPDILRKAVETVKPGLGSKVVEDPYGKALPMVKAKNSVTIDKIKVAREVSKLSANLNRLDLQEKIQQLVEFIKTCNK